MTAPWHLRRFAVTIMNRDSLAKALAIYTATGTMCVMNRLEQLLHRPKVMRVARACGHCGEAFTPDNDPLKLPIQEFCSRTHG